MHPCNLEISLHGFALLEAACRSALDHRRIDLPLRDDDDALERMQQEVRHFE